MGSFVQKNEYGMIVGDFEVSQTDADDIGPRGLGKSWTVTNRLVTKWLGLTDECIVRFTLNPVQNLGGEWYIEYEGQTRPVSDHPLEEAKQLLLDSSKGRAACKLQTDYEHRALLDAVHWGDTVPRP